MNKIDSRGVTIVEVLVAMGAFVVGMAALLQVFTQSITMGKRTEAAYTAFNLAKNHAERLKGFDFSSLASAAEDSVVVNADGQADSGGQFTRTTEVTVNYAGKSDLTQVTVKVYYKVKGVQSATPMELTTVIYGGS